MTIHPPDSRQQLAITTSSVTIVDETGSVVTLINLPLELRAQILAHADLKTIFAADATCKALHEAVEFNAPYTLASARAKTLSLIHI